jgi:CDP-diacylglycerol--glycerol-3-phosphate 3-phosphatidyltransferase
MNVADSLTTSRLFMAPFFFIIFMYGSRMGLPAAVVVIMLWVLFILAELSDLLDGMVARAMQSVSAFGKVFDPFADVLVRITYFVCFAWAGLMPIWVLMIILYREFSILFLRLMLTERGIAMGARPGGKTKAVVYVLAGTLSLAEWSITSMEWPTIFVLPGIIHIAYILAALLSVGSFIDYVIQFRKLTARN